MSLLQPIKTGYVMILRTVGTPSLFWRQQLVLALKQSKTKALSIVMLIIMMACAPPNNTANALYSSKPDINIDGWVMVGQKADCILYMQIVSGHRVFWSVCDASRSSSSVTAD